MIQTNNGKNYTEQVISNNVTLCKYVGPSVSILTLANKVITNGQNKPHLSSLQKKW